jgi:hypothetical protein
MRKPTDLNEEQCDQIGGNDASDQSHMMVCSEAATDHVNERLNNLCYTIPGVFGRLSIPPL